MSITLPLTTAAERAASLAALTTYVHTLDGATLDTAQLSHADNPETGIEVEQLVQVAPAPTHIPTAAEAFATPTASLSPPGMVYAPIPPAPVLAPPPAANAEADINGELWSAEKHSSTKAKNKDGSWRVKRGVGDAPPAPPAPVAPPAPPAPVAAAPVQAGAPTNFKELMDLVMPLMKAGKITSAGIAEACAMNGVANLPALNQNLGAIPNVWATIEAMAV